MDAQRLRRGVVVRQGVEQVANVRYGEGREALLAATVYEVGKSGLANLTFRSVASRAGVNNSLISRHFGTKDALVKEAMRWSLERSVRLSELAEITEIDDEFAERLFALIWAEPHHQMFQYEMLLASRRHPGLREDAVALYEGYLSALEEGLAARGHDQPRPLARAVFASLDGLVLQSLTVAEADDCTEAMLRVGNLLRLDRARN